MSLVFEQGPFEGNLFEAIQAYRGDEDEDELSFKQGDVIKVLDQGKGPGSWWYGELDGVRGTFPGGCVIPLLPSAQLPQEPMRQPKISFSDKTTDIQVYTHDEYDRRGDYNPGPASAEWAKEEAEEKLRMLQVRWEYFERSLGGQKCQERLDWEKEQAELEAQRKAEEEQKRLERLEKKRLFMEAKAARQAAKDKELAENGNGDSAVPNASPSTVEGGSRAERLSRLSDFRKGTQAPTIESANDGVDPETKARLERLAALAQARKAPAPPVKNEAVPLPQQNTTPSLTVAAQKRDNNGPKSEDGPVDDHFSPSNGHYEAVSLPASSSKKEQSDDGKTEIDVATVERVLVAFQKKIQELTEVNEVSGMDGFGEEFKKLDREDKKSYASSQCKVAQSFPDRNRYKDILPFDRTRVVLFKEREDAQSDYINASHIASPFAGFPAFIASQGPTPSTTSHFWKMISQQRSQVIVMLTRTKEGGKTKCHEYWPSSGAPLVFDASNEGNKTRVTSVQESELDAWTERVFNVDTLNEEGIWERQEVTHLQFTGFPDHGVPKCSTTFLAFLMACMKANSRYSEAVKQKKGKTEADPPITVHCSAGVGRSGVFCVIYGLLGALSYVGRVQAKSPLTLPTITSLDVMETIRYLREQRRYMVQTVDQYQFCYTTLLDAAKLYVEGLTLTASSPVEEFASTALPNDPVWLYSKTDENSLGRILMASPSEGKFVVSLVEANAYKLSVVVESKVRHFAVSVNDSKNLAIEGREFAGKRSIVELVDHLRHVHIEDDFPTLLLEYVPRPDASPALVDQEQLKAAQIIAFNNANPLQPPPPPPRSSVPTLSSEAPPRPKRGIMSNSPSPVPDDGADTPPPIPPRSSRPSSPVSPRISVLEPGSSPPTLAASNKGLTQMPQSKLVQSFCPGHTILEDAKYSTEPLNESYQAMMKAWTKQQLDKDVSRLKRRTSSLAKTESQLMKEASVIFAHSRASYSSPPSAILHSPKRDQGGDVVIQGRTGPLSFINGRYAELLVMLFNRPCFKLQKTAECGLESGHDVYIYYEGNALSWIIYSTKMGVVGSASGNCDHAGDVITFWAILDASGETLVEDQEVAIFRSLGDKGSRSSAQNGDALLWENLRASHAREKILCELLASANFAQGQLTQARRREEELLTELARLQQLLVSRVAVDLADAEAKDTSSKRAQEQLERMGAEIRQLKNDLDDLKQVNAELMEENEELKDYFHETQNASLVVEASMHMDPRKLSFGLGRHGGDEEDEEEENEASKMARIQALRQSALESADEFNRTVNSDKVDPSPRRGLPVGALLDELDDDQEEEEDNKLSLNTSAQKRGLPAGTLWDELDGEEEAEDAPPSFSSAKPFTFVSEASDTQGVNFYDDDDDDDSERHQTLDTSVLNRSTGFNGDIYIALRTYAGAGEGELSFKAGDDVIVTSEKGDWWHGICGGRRGIFPASYVGIKM